MTVSSRPPAESFLEGFTFSSPDARLVRYVREVRSVVPDGRPLADRAGDVRRAGGQLAREGCELSPCCLGVGAEPYGRNLVYRDPDYGFVVISMVWPAGTDAPAHDHGTWCCVAVLEGKVRIECFERRRDSDAELQRVEVCDAGVGDTCMILPPADVHAVTNPFGERAVTLHTYGKDITRCSTFDLERGTRQVRDLGYQNR